MAVLGAIIDVCLSRRFPSFAPTFFDCRQVVELPGTKVPDLLQQAELLTSFICRNVDQVVGRLKQIFLPWRQKICFNLLVEFGEMANGHFYQIHSPTTVHLMLGVRGKLRFPR